MIRHITKAYVIATAGAAVALFCIAALPLYPTNADMITNINPTTNGNNLSNTSSFNTPFPTTSQTPTPSSNTSQSSNTSNTSNANSSIGQDINPLKNGGTLCDFLVTLLNIITEIGAVIGVLVLLGVGFFYILAQGNKEKLEAAHRAFLMSVLGITLLLGASVLAHILITTVNTVLSAGGGGFANQSALTCSP